MTTLEQPTKFFPTDAQLAFDSRPGAYLQRVRNFFETHAPERLSAAAAPELYLAALRELCDTCAATAAAKMWARDSEGPNVGTPLSETSAAELHLAAFWRHGLAREIRERGRRRAHFPGDWQQAALQQVGFISRPETALATYQRRDLQHA